jgi:hypothetical protein
VPLINYRGGCPLFVRAFALARRDRGRDRRRERQRQRNRVRYTERREGDRQTDTVTETERGREKESTFYCRILLFCNSEQKPWANLEWHVSIQIPTPGHGFNVSVEYLHNPDRESTFLPRFSSYSIAQINIFLVT